MLHLPKSAFWAACCILLLGSTAGQAFDGASSFVVTLPFQADQATPVWLGHPSTPPTNFATLDLPIIPPSPDDSLLITVFFQEKEGGFLRISWENDQDAQTLSDNFYEGIAMPNQRSLLIPAETLTGSGHLHFQCGDATLGISRIKLEWLEKHPGLAAPEVNDLLVTPASQLTLRAPTLDGQPNGPGDVAWHNQIVDVPITDTPQRIEQGVEFPVQLDSLPQKARLVLKESGLPLNKHLVIWINQQRAGTITPVVPDLQDEGHGTPVSATYTGWRDGSFYVPVALLKAGVNAIQLSTEDEIPSGAPADSTSTAAAPTTPLAVKEIVLQVDNGPASPPPSAMDAPAVETSLPTPAEASPVVAATPAATSPSPSLSPLSASTLSLRPELPNP